MQIYIWPETQGQHTHFFLLMRRCYHAKLLVKFLFLKVKNLLKNSKMYTCISFIVFLNWSYLCTYVLSLSHTHTQTHIHLYTTYRHMNTYTSLLQNHPHVGCRLHDSLPFNTKARYFSKTRAFYLFNYTWES